MDMPIIYNLNTYLPSYYGTRLCIRKSLAGVEMRVVAVSADGYDAEQWDKDL